MPMKKLDLKEVGQAKNNPLFDGMPDKLKNVRIFNKIEKELFDLVQTDHKHKTVKSYVTCAWCNKKREMRQNRIKVLGFASLNQYMEWKKIMMLIKNKSKFQIR